MLFKNYLHMHRQGCESGSLSHFSFIFPWRYEVMLSLQHWASAPDFRHRRFLLWPRLPASGCLVNEREDDSTFLIHKVLSKVGALLQLARSFIQEPSPMCLWVKSSRKIVKAPRLSPVLKHRTLQSPKRHAHFLADGKYLNISMKS